MIIEFTAIPGSGKTYLSESLYSYFKKEYQESQTLIYTRRHIEEEKKTINRAIRYSYIFISLMNLNILRFILYIFKSEGKYSVKKNKFKYLINIMMNHKLIDKIIKEEENKCIFILDEGILHLSTIFMDNQDRSIKNKWISDYIQIINKTRGLNYKINKNIYVFIDCNFKENYERIYKRSQGWPKIWENISEKGKRAALEDSFEKYNILKRYISSNNYPYETIDNRVFHDDYTFYFDKIKNIFESNEGT